MAKAITAKNKQTKINWANVRLVIKTVVICAILVGAVGYHLISLRNVEKKAYLEGARAFKQVEQGR